MRRLLAVFLLAMLGALAAAGPAGALQIKLFHIAGDNIGCAMIFGKETSGGAARCDIREHSWPTPKKPPSCEVDYGQGLSVDAQGRGGFVCAGDTTLGQGRVLAEGSSVRLGPYECTNLGKAVRCVNHRTKHGFKLSPRVAQRF